eukprot:2240250-Pleurochrysis_carterae.AAC.2
MYKLVCDAFAPHYNINARKHVHRTQPIHKQARSLMCTHPHSLAHIHETWAHTHAATCRHASVHIPTRARTHLHSQAHLFVLTLETPLSRVHPSTHLPTHPCTHPTQPRSHHPTHAFHARTHARTHARRAAPRDVPPPWATAVCVGPQSLEDLDRSLRALNSRLVVLRGSPLEQLELAFERWQINQIAYEIDTEPYAKERDAAVCKMAQKTKVKCGEVGKGWTQAALAFSGGCGLCIIGCGYAVYQNPNI